MGKEFILDWNFQTYDQLSSSLIYQYEETVKQAFPPIIQQSQVIQDYWPFIEKYFPKYQIFAIDRNENLIGLANTIPFHWGQLAAELPNEGWDWMIQKGVEDFENNRLPNYLGGLQIIVNKKYLNRGYSKYLIAAAKELMNKNDLDHFAIPIRPTLKHEYPEMHMSEYMRFKKTDKIYDPWIRTHINQGAKYISICENSMNIKGDVKFWESLSDKRINSSGAYFIKGALSPVHISIEKDQGEYREANIWICYEK